MAWNVNTVNTLSYMLRHFLIAIVSLEFVRNVKHLLTGTHIKIWLRV